MACDSILFVDTMFVDTMEDYMPWNDIARRQHNREGLRYPSDLTDREGELLQPLGPHQPNLAAVPGAQKCVRGWMPFCISPPVGARGVPRGGPVADVAG